MIPAVELEVLLTVFVGGLILLVQDELYTGNPHPTVLARHVLSVEHQVHE